MKHPQSPETYEESSITEANVPSTSEKSETPPPPSSPPPTLGKKEEKPVNGAKPPVDLENERMKKEILDLQEKLREANERALRVQAEFANARKRMNEQNQRERLMIKADLFKNLITIYEEFFQISANIIAPDIDLKKYHDGIGKLYAKFDKVLREADLQPFASPGDDFDPSLHQAVQMTPTPSAANDHKIDKILGRGYKVGDMVIKPAIVAVFQFEAGKPAE